MSRGTVSFSALRKVVVDGFLIIAMSISLFLVKKIWVPFRRGFFCEDESLMFPYRDDTVTVTMLRLYGFLLPGLAILICEWVLLRREKDSTSLLGVRIPTWVRGVYCVVISFALGVLFVELSTDIAKNVIGRLRPHFFDLCKPSVDCGLPEWRGRYIQPHQYRCNTQHIHDPYKLKNMGLSFPSGHSSLAAYTMVYFALYLERRMTSQCTRLLRHSMQFSALMLSWFTALSRVSDFKHHWSDVLAGYSLGIIIAFVMFTYGTDLVQPKKPAQHDVTSQEVVISNLEPTAVENDRRNRVEHEATALTGRNVVEP